MIEKDHPQPHPAEEIEPEVALDGKRKRCLIGHHALSNLSCWVSARDLTTPVGLSGRTRRSKLDLDTCNRNVCFNPMYSHHQLGQLRPKVQRADMQPSGAKDFAA